jgi:acyl-homoserine-lactone acylase
MADERQQPSLSRRWTGSDLNPSAFAPELGIETNMTNRAARAWRLMSEPGPIDRARLERIKYDTGYERQGYIERMLREMAALNVKEQPELQEARRLLFSWDMTADNQGRADALALLITREYMVASYQNKPYPEPRKTLADAASHLREHFGRLDPPMSALLRLRQVRGLQRGPALRRRVRHAARSEQLGRRSRRPAAGEAWRQLPPVRRMGTTAAVRSQSIQPFGAATTRPGSVHFTDQSTLFVQHRLKPVHFWRDDVLANARLRQIVTTQVRNGG